MSEIQVNTGDLYNGSQNLKVAANEIGNVQNQVSSASASVGNAYDGQLRQAIEVIVDGSTQTGARLQNRAVELGNELFNRAARFEVANETGRSAVLGMSTEYQNHIRTTPILGYLSFLSKVIAKGLPFWNVSGLIIDGLRRVLHNKLNTERVSSTNIDNNGNSTVETDTNTKEPSSPISNQPVQVGTPTITQYSHPTMEENPRGIAIDIGTDKPNETEIHSIVGGKILKIGPDTDNQGNIKGYGNYIKVLQDDGVVVIYAHLKDQPENIKPGIRVETGEKIGMMGSTGYSTNTHLHLEFREPKFDENGNYAGDTTGYVKNNFNPIKYLKEKGIEL